MRVPLTCPKLCSLWQPGSRLGSPRCLLSGAFAGLSCREDTRLQLVAAQRPLQWIPCATSPWMELVRVAGPEVVWKSLNLRFGKILGDSCAHRGLRSNLVRRAVLQSGGWYEWGICLFPAHLDGPGAIHLAGAGRFWAFLSRCSVSLWVQASSSRRS